MYPPGFAVSITLGVMARPFQATEERHYFEQFAEHFQLPEGEVVFGDKPDVKILGQRKIGVEIASLYKQDGSDPAAEKAQMVVRASVIKLAERLYLESQLRRIELGIDFDPQFPIRIKKQTAEILAQKAIEISKMEGEYTAYKPIEDAPEVRFLTCNGIEYMDAKWHSAQSYDVPSLAVERVRELVAQKAKKVAQYEACDEYWLLLVVEFWDPSQDQYIDWPEGELVDKSPFSRVLIYKPQFKQVTEVPS
jgi:hypothetical protein